MLQQFYGDTGTFHDSQLPIARFMADHGLRYYTEYHPNSSFASFQAIEVALFLGLAATLLTAAIWLTRRRTA